MKKMGQESAFAALVAEGFTCIGFIALNKDMSPYIVWEKGVPEEQRIKILKDWLDNHEVAGEGIPLRTQ